MSKTFIHPSANVSSDAKIGDGSKIWIKLNDLLTQTFDDRLRPFTAAAAELSRHNKEFIGFGIGR